LALYSTREITSNVSSAKMATKRFSSRTESKFGTRFLSLHREYGLISPSWLANQFVGIHWILYFNRIFSIVHDLFQM
jgi:hypothetical protein